MLDWIQAPENQLFAGLLFGVAIEGLLCLLAYTISQIISEYRERKNQK